MKAIPLLVVFEKVEEAELSALSTISTTHRLLGKNIVRIRIETR